MSPEYPRCPVCGDPIDYCQGHGRNADPLGYMTLSAHDNGDHSRCHEHGCDMSRVPSGVKQ